MPAIHSHPFARPKDFALEVAVGNIPGVSSEAVAGRNIEIDASVVADIWDGGFTVGNGGVSLIWLPPTAARIHAIVSTVDNDSDSGGTNPQSDGCRTIKVRGLTSWSAAEVSETVVMDGTQAVNTVNSYVIINFMECLTKGGNAAGPNVGTITATAASDATITAQIRPTVGETRTSIRGIPSIQTALLGRFYGNVNKAGGAAGLVDLGLFCNPEPDAELTNFNNRHTFGLQTVGTSALTINFAVWKKMPGPCIIKIQAVSGTNDMDVSSGYDMILRNN